MDECLPACLPSKREDRLRGGGRGGAMVDEEDLFILTRVFACLTWLYFGARGASGSLGASANVALSRAY